MKEKTAQAGQIVISKAGRDKGRWYVVTELIDEQYVNVVDGELRKLERPKKKKLKHLDVKPMIAESIAHKLASHKRVMDAEIRSFLGSSLGNVKTDDERSE